MIEDQVAEVAQHKRLGHRLAGVRGIYSHVSPAMIQHLPSGLQRRWDTLIPEERACVPGLVTAVPRALYASTR